VPERPQAFLSFYLKLRGAKPEAPTYARIAVYGEGTPAVYDHLRRGTWVEVEARYRVRHAPELHEAALRRAGEVLLAQLGDAAPILPLATAVVDALEDLRHLSDVHEFVARPHQVHIPRLGGAP
jgi:hypothetical protein